jgi:HK97 family phage prohead protease
MPDVIRKVARENLSRMVGFVQRAVPEGQNDDGRTLDGYGAVFPTTLGDREDPATAAIDSWEGCFLEQNSPGAFKKSLREQRPRMQFDHGRHPLIGSIPIGTYDDGYPVEEPQGLHCLGRLMENWLVEPIREAIASRAVDGMSFRFSVVRDEWYDPQGKKLTDPQRIMEMLWNPPEDGPLLRILREVKLPEVGPVVWPAYTETTVDVRSRVIDLARLHEPDTRKLLAQAVLMADAHDGEHSMTARPRSSVATPARHVPVGAPAGSGGTPGEHREPTRIDEPARLRTDLSRWLSSRRVVIEHIQRRT